MMRRLKACQDLCGLGILDGQKGIEGPVYSHPYYSGYREARKITLDRLTPLFDLLMLKWKLQRA